MLNSIMIPIKHDEGDDFESTIKCDIFEDIVYMLW